MYQLQTILKTALVNSFDGKSSKEEIPMTRFRTFIVMIAALIGWLLFGFAGHTTELTAAWATDAAVCKKVFEKRGSTISFAQNSDFYGSEIIIEKNRIRVKMATCKINSRKEDGAVVHMILVCEGDALIANVPFSLKIDDDNRITRIFPGTPELNTSYYRCSL